MQKYSRNSRISAITKILIENPNKIMSLNYFSEMLNAAKSTISEDILVIREILESLDMGKIETIAGATGGVRYVARMGEQEERDFAESICETLRDKSRIVPGNFLYITDIMLDPTIVHRAGIVLASKFSKAKADYVITVETKGIPLAYEVARYLGVPLIVARKNSKVTEGTSVTINYVSGTTGRLANMGLAKRTLKSSSRCLFIDDFLRAGGTVNGIADLLNEFDSELIGIGVLVDNKEVPKKLPTPYTSLVDYFGVNEDGNVVLEVSKNI
ncbi:pur operon repressor [Proteiniclasticum sp.]|uniref:pur operon repressor n=1 Tax=Proteiniclasticum sp. TaxID=2053595 RepID=UPI0028986A67|nr:pur operon repressor [Proteiniclasticum sp.]